MEGARGTDSAARPGGVRGARKADPAVRPGGVETEPAVRLGGGRTDPAARLGGGHKLEEKEGFALLRDSGSTPIAASGAEHLNLESGELPVAPSCVVMASTCRMADKTT